MTLQIRVILISTLVYILSPLLAIFFSGLWLYRFFLSLWKTIWHPRFGPLLQGLDSAMVNHSPYGGEELLTVSVYLTVGGRIQLEEFRTVVEKGFDKIRKSDDQSPKPNRSIRRFRQVLTTYGGFSVGEDETNFKMSDHVRLLNVDELNERVDRQCQCQCTSVESESEIKAKRKAEPRKILLEKKIHQNHFTPDELCALNRSFLRIPFEEKKSPWEMLILYNPNSTSKSESGLESKVGEDVEKWTTVLFFRLNHSLADGIAILSLFSQFFDQPPEHSFGTTLDLFSNDKDRVKKRRASFLQLFLTNLWDFLFGVPEFISHALKAIQEDRPPTNLNLEQEQEREGERERPRAFHTFSYEIPRGKVKKIQQSAAAAVRTRDSGDSGPKLKSTTVFIAALASAVVKYSQDQGNEFSSSSLAKNVIVIVAGSRRRNEMTNNFSLVTVPLPRAPSKEKQGTKTATLDFLLQIDKSYSSHRNSRIRRLSEILVVLMGLLPLKWKPPLFLLCKGLAMSHVPSLENPVTILDKPVLAMQGGASTPTPLSTVMYFWESWDKVNGSFIVLKDILPSHLKAQGLAKCYEKQFDDIYQDINEEGRK